MVLSVRGAQRLAQISQSGAKTCRAFKMWGDTAAMQGVAESKAKRKSPQL
jgi:hypothetical protein